MAASKDFVLSREFNASRDHLWKCHTSMTQGWTGTMEQLEAHLANAKG